MITHIDNREGQVLVPVNVQALLLILLADGWLREKVDALACEMPPLDHELRKIWIDAYRDVIAESDGLLPPLEHEKSVEITASRGSHMTAAVRLYKYQCKGIHDEFCNADGMMSKAKIIERQPSRAIPLEGVPYTVRRFPLAEQCPELMEFLSRTGNVTAI